MCGGLDTANERNLGVEVVHDGGLTEGGDSILRVFSWELLKLKLILYIWFTVERQEVQS